MDSVKAFFFRWRGANHSWPFTDLRHLVKMAVKQGNRKTRLARLRNGFRISRNPVVHFVANGHDHDESPALRSATSPPLLFAIARDPRTIFASWTIDWPSVFKQAIPVERKVHLRIYRAGDCEEKSVAVEPMATMHYITIPQAEGSYRLDIGYYRPADVWHSVATSQEVVMPRSTITEAGEVRIATIPFHLSFQRLIDSFGSSNGSGIAHAVSRLQKRAVTDEERALLTRDEQEALGAMNLSANDISAAREAFLGCDTKPLRRHARALSGSGGSSASQACPGSSWR